MLFFVYHYDRGEALTFTEASLRDQYLLIDALKQAKAAEQKRIFFILIPKTRELLAELEKLQKFS